MELILEIILITSSLFIVLLLSGQILSGAITKMCILTYSRPMT